MVLSRDKIVPGLFIATITSTDLSIYSGVLYNKIWNRRLTAAKCLEKLDGWGLGWSQVTRVTVGGLLVDCLMEVVEVERMAIDKKTDKTVNHCHLITCNVSFISLNSLEMLPTFYHIIEYECGSRIDIIRLNPAVSE